MHNGTMHNGKMEQCTMQNGTMPHSINFKVLQQLCQKQFHRVQRLPFFCQQRFEDEKLWFSLNLAASAISIQRAPSDDNKGLVKLLLYRPAK